MLATEGESVPIRTIRVSDVPVGPAFAWRETSDLLRMSGRQLAEKPCAPEELTGFRVYGKLMEFGERSAARGQDAA